jgi:hypothetical protein
LAELIELGHTDLLTGRVSVTPTDELKRNLLSFSGCGKVGIRQARTIKYIHNTAVLKKLTYK